jgi:hypothetical protein
VVSGDSVLADDDWVVPDDPVPEVDRVVSEDSVLLDDDSSSESPQSGRTE